ncbi:MAG: hypothetical protein ACI4NM_01785 [Bullifex sp.]
MEDYLTFIVELIGKGKRKAVAEFEYIIKMLHICGYGVEMGSGNITIKELKGDGFTEESA